MSHLSSIESRLNAKISELDPQIVYVVGIAVFRPKTELDEDGVPQLLLVQRAAHESLPNLWELPGGGVEPSETIREAAFRELREETGLTATEILGECMSRTWKSPRSGKTWLKFNFVAKVEQPVEIALDPNEHQKWRWLKESDLETFDFQANEDFAKEQHEVVADAFLWYQNNNEKCTSYATNASMSK